MTVVATELGTRSATIVRINWKPHAVIGGIILALAIVDAVWLALSPVDLDMSSTLLFLQVPALLTIIAIVYYFFRPAPRLAMIALALAELFAFAVPGIAFSCLMTSLGRPLADDLFAAWDAALGFSWISYVDFVSSRPWLYIYLALLYASPRYQICLLIAFLSIQGRFETVHRLIANLIVSAIIISFIGGLVPAFGGYTHYDVPRHGTFDFASLIQAFHRGEGLISVTVVKGIITFPSYHAAMSVAIMLASWPMRRLRYFALILNIMLLAGVPVHGAHYLVDLIVGTAVVLIVDQAWRLIDTKIASRAQRSLAN